MNLPLEKKIRIASIISDTSMSQLAEALDISSASLTKRLQNGKFSIAELNKFAEAMGCKYICRISFDTEHIFDNESGKKTYGDIINAARKYRRLTNADIGTKLNITPQAVRLKLNNERFSIPELLDYVDAIDGDLEFYFDFGDDMEI